MRTPASTPGRDAGREKILGIGGAITVIADSEDMKEVIPLRGGVGVAWRSCRELKSLQPKPGAPVSHESGFL
jgi:hypothetical protein